MDEFVKKGAGLGLPLVILLITMSTTGLVGAAAITAALAMLGPGGMIGGIVLLGIIGMAGEALAKFGIEAVLAGLYQERLRQGESLEKLVAEIDGLPTSYELKLKLKDFLQQYQNGRGGSVSVVSRPSEND